MLQIKTDLYRYVHYTSNVAVCNYQEIIGCDVSFMVVLISERHGGLFYISRLLEKYVNSESLYASTQVKIPEPHFIIFSTFPADICKQRLYKLGL